MRQAEKGKLNEGDCWINGDQCLWYKNGEVIECNRNNWLGLF